MDEPVDGTVFPAGRAVALLRGAGRAVARSRTEQELLDEICRLAVEVAGYRMAWVGFARDDERKSVECVAHAGVNRGYLEEIEVTWGSAPSGRGPTGTAIRTRKPVTASSLTDDANFGPWRDAALERGYAASIAVPVETADGVIGTLNIYAGEPDAFPADEMQLLDDLGRELAFGIQSVRTREARDRAVERLVESEARTRAIFEAIPDMMLRLDRRGVVRGFVPSKDFPPLLLPEEFLGREIGDVIPAPLAAATKRDLAAVLATGTTQTREYELVLGGEQRSFEYRLARSGKDEVLAIVREVTARREAERALRQSEERMRSIVEHSTNLFYSHGPDHVLTYLSPQVEQVLGYPAHEAMRRWTEFLTDDPGNQRGLELTQRAIDTGERQPPYELELLHRSGRRVWVEVREAPVVQGGRTVAIVGSLTDITERRRYENELRESREALRQLAANLEEAREAERRRVARELHDELGQALTGLKMDVAWLRDRLGEDDALGRMRVEETLGLIHTTVDAVRRISAELRPGVLDDLGLAAAIRWQTREFMRRTNIGVRLESDDAVPELDSGRATAVFRIFQEALTNVTRHSSASEVLVRIAMEHGQLLLRIEDNGRGLRPEEIRSRRSMGLLGMRERASAWGGTLALGERPEGGTAVELRMPLPDEVGGT